MKAIGLAAVLAVAMLAPAAASAGPKFSELEQAVPSELVEADAIYQKMVEALGGDADAIKQVQDECGLGKTGDLGPRAKRCVRAHAETIASARKHAAEDRQALEDKLAQCGDNGDACSANLKRVSDERDAALAKAKSGDGEFGELEGICAKVNLSQYVGMCDPVAQNVRCVTDAKTPYSFTLTCVPKRVSVEVAKLVILPGGKLADAEFDPKPQKGTLTPSELPWQTAPQPMPKAKGTCSGFGGVMLCYVLPTAVTVAAGLLVADGLSDNFNLVTVRR